MEKYEMPVGLGMALAMNPEAMEKFSALSEDKKQEIINVMHWGVEPIRIGTGILGYFSRLVLDLHPASLRTLPTKLSQKSLVRMCFAVLGEQIVVRSRKRLTTI